MNTLVLGIGNLLLTDEAIGVRVVEAFEREYQLPAGVTVLDGGTAGMELLDDMANREHLIVVDAVLSGNPPGSMIVLRDEEVPALFSRKISPHQLGLADVLSAMHLTGEFPQRLTLIGIEPASLEPHIGLSEQLNAVLPQAVDQLVTILKADGCQLQQKGTD